VARRPLCQWQIPGGKLYKYVYILGDRSVGSRLFFLSRAHVTEAAGRGHACGRESVAWHRPSTAAPSSGPGSCGGGTEEPVAPPRAWRRTPLASDAGFVGARRALDAVAAGGQCRPSETFRDAALSGVSWSLAPGAGRTAGGNGTNIA
jgi:hypothetical protein